MISRPGLRALVEAYDQEAQLLVRFRPSSWKKALAASNSHVTDLLMNDDYTDMCVGGRPALPGDRLVAREDVIDACLAMDLDDLSQVLQAFVLTMAWGSGTTGARSLRNTARALIRPDEAHEALAASARILRKSEFISAGHLAKAHATFSLPGVRQAFFTKWFAFAGHVGDRSWQPLILDSRVYATLNYTFDIDTASLAGTRSRAVRYQAYVDHMHQWAEELAIDGIAADAQQLEWIFFEHRGKPVPKP
jgi:hypothetical protein